MSRLFSLSYVIVKYKNDENNQDNEKKLDYSVRKDLVSFSSLLDLDEYVQRNFYHSKEVRERYQEEINDFCNNNQRAKDLLTKLKGKSPNRKSFGEISIICKDGNEEYKIPIMYKEGKRLKALIDCLNILKEKIKDNNIVKELYSKKKYLFSPDDLADLKATKYILDGYNGLQDDVKRLESLKTSFYRRLKRFDDEYKYDEEYYYFRCMMDILGLYNGNNKTYANITSYDKDKISKIPKAKVTKKITESHTDIMLYDDEPTSEREEVTVIDSAPEEFKYAFYKALDTGDFDLLYNIYSLEEIEKYTQGKRK